MNKNDLIKETKMEVTYSYLTFKEGNVYVAYTPQLDISSCGKNQQEAGRMLKKAVKLFIKEAERMETLREILIESGYEEGKNGIWTYPPIYEIVMEEKV
jgi:hypothetical protein